MAIDIEKLKKVAFKHALKNAYEHEGKALVNKVIPKVIFEMPEVKKSVKEIVPIVKEVVEEVNKLSLEKQEELLKELYPEVFEKKEEEKKELKDIGIKGYCCFRAAPAMTGYPHIGHVYNILINYLYAKKYNGDFVVRYEDTDAKIAKEEYYREFDFLLDFLEIEYKEKKIISRDYMETLYNYGRKLIEQGNAYVCLKSKEEISKARMNKVELEDRNRSIEENLELFDKMLSNYFDEGEAVVLLKGDMRSENSRLRDPTLFRIVKATHPITKDKYIVWPSYDFAVAICDALQKVTHIIRSKEFELAKELHDLLRELLGFPKITTIEVSRVKIKNNLTSKRKIRALIEKGLISGWDDPRLVTLRGLIRRGIVKETFYEFVKQLGISKAKREIEFDYIASLNKKFIDKKARRFFAVPNYIMLKVENCNNGKVKIPYHPYEDLGYREITYGDTFYVPKEVLDKKEFRLMHLFNVEIIGKEGDVYIAKITGEEIKKELLKVQWVPKGFEKWVKLIIPKDPIVNGEFNKDSLQIVKIPVEKNIEEVKVNEIIQFERFGFARKDARDVFIFSHK